MKFGDLMRARLLASEALSLFYTHVTQSWELSTFFT